MVFATDAMTCSLCHISSLSEDKLPHLQPKHLYSCQELTNQSKQIYSHRKKRPFHSLISITRCIVAILVQCLLNIKPQECQSHQTAM